ncbi:MAG: hypothetical protein PHU25_01225 [Deltaproteobacteria bacterium]|nr:hypothetical protein [Deltaproteobacteria bacterium]
MKNGGFIMFRRTQNAREILKKPKAFTLLAQIAQRARRKGALTLNGLGVGEALIGDHESIGLSEQSYRSAKKQLAAAGLATFHPTSRGTVARLVDDTIFNINGEDVNGRNNRLLTGRQRTNND